MFCTNCGKRIADDSVYCTHCGKRVGVEKATGKSKVTIGVFFLIVALIAGFIAWRASPYWPWPSQKEIEKRLDEVVDICTNHEYSSECLKKKKLYHMKFKYCEKVKNMNMIEWSITGKNEGIYAIAWLDEYATPNDMSDDTGINYFTGYKYVNCKDSLKDF